MLTENQFFSLMTELYWSKHRAVTPRMLAHSLEVQVPDIESALQSIQDVQFVTIIGYGTGKFSGLVFSHNTEDVCGIMIRTFDTDFWYQGQKLRSIEDIERNSEEKKQEETIKITTFAKKHGLPLIRSFQTLEERLQEVVPTLYAKYLTQQGNNHGSLEAQQ